MDSPERFGRSKRLANVALQSIGDRSRNASCDFSRYGHDSPAMPREALLNMPYRPMRRVRIEQTPEPFVKSHSMRYSP